MATDARRAWLFDFGAGLHAVVGGQHMAEYLRAPQVIEVPLAPAAARGVLVWRERLVPLLDLARLAGEARDEPLGAIVLAYRETPQAPLEYGALTLAAPPREIEVRDDMACDLPVEPAFWGLLAASCMTCENRATPILRVRNIFTQALVESGAPVGAGVASKFTGKPSIGPIHPIAEDPSKDLATLEWMPGLAPTQPPAVKAPPPKSLIPSVAAVEAAAAVPPPVRMPNPFDAVDEEADPPPMLFDLVEPREPAPAAPRAEAPASKPPQPAKAARLFDTAEPRQQSAPLFDTVEPRVPSAPLFDVVDPRAAPPAAAAPAPVRISLGARGEYALNKIVRKQANGSDELLCYELMRNGKPIKRGTQEQIKLAFKEALAGA